MITKNYPYKIMNQLILSLTSYKARFPFLSYCLKQLFEQTIKPDQIVLYLDNDVHLLDIPDEILYYQSLGLEIVFTKYQLKSHTKYFFAMQDYPDDLIITVDDDAYYETDMVAKLLKSYNQFPFAVSAGRVHRILLSEQGFPLPYIHWEHECLSTLKPAMDLFATGVGGVLYPPHCLSPEAFCTKSITKLCLFGDDIWLKFMELRQGTPVSFVPMKYKHPQTIEGSQVCALYKENMLNSRNDRYLMQMQEKYPVNFTELFFKSEV